MLKIVARSHLDLLLRILKDLVALHGTYIHRPHIYKCKLRDTSMHTLIHENMNGDTYIPTLPLHIHRTHIYSITLKNALPHSNAHKTECKPIIPHRVCFLVSSRVLTPATLHQQSHLPKFRSLVVVLDILHARVLSHDIFGEPHVNE